jgi:hypothetical protein
MKLFITPVVLLAASLLLGACRSSQTTKTAATVPSDAPHILFLHLMMTDSSVKLLDRSIEPGTLKQKRSQPSGGGIYYDVTSTSGELLWSGDFDDPLVKHLEYEDPEHSGEIRSKIVRTGEAEVTLRIPYIEGRSYIDFYRFASSQSGEPARRPIDRIQLE